MNRLPFIQTVTRRPVFDSDGELLFEAGYHRKAKLWHQADSSLAIDSFQVPEDPTEEEVLSAVLVLEREMAGLPFRSIEDKERMVLALAEPFVKRVIDGLAPAYAIFSKDEKLVSTICRWHSQICSAGHGLIRAPEGCTRGHILEKACYELKQGNSALQIDFQGGSQEDRLNAVDTMIGDESDYLATWLITRGDIQEEGEFDTHSMNIWLDEPRSLTDRWKTRHAAGTDLECRLVVVALLTLIRAGLAVDGPIPSFTDKPVLSRWDSVMKKIAFLYREHREDADWLYPESSRDCLEPPQWGLHR